MNAHRDDPVNTPNQWSAGAVEPKVFDAEFVDDTPPHTDTPDSRERWRLLRRVMLLIGRVWRSERVLRLRTVAGYRLRMLPRDLLRLLWFALRGHWRWAVKAWTFLTYGDLRADARAARLARDAEARRDAQDAIRAQAKARWAKVGLLLHRAGIAALVVIVAAIALIITDAVLPRERMWDWLATSYDVLSIVSTVARDLVLIAPVVWLIAAVYEGRDLTPGAGWLIHPQREDADSWVDERMISKALAHLGIAPLNTFFKDGGELVYTVPARRDGDGTFAQVRLPMGVTADMVAAQRAKLAANLGRASLETWPTKGEEDGLLDLWIADKHTLGGGAGQWPLQHDGTVDVFEGVPFGCTQRGVVINAPLVEANWLIGGRPGQGKSSALRTLLLGAALDVTAELWVFVMGESPDFDPFTPRLSRYAMGMDDTVAQATLAALEDLLEEMERRGKILGAQPGRPPKVSRKLADKGHLGLHPLLCAIDECHELYQHPTYGKRAEELAVRLIKRGRKYGIILLLATQSPTKDSIPKEITRNVSCGIAFAVADHVANDGLLGSGKYKAGVRATELRMKTDCGTCVAVGLTDATFELVRTFYIPFEDEVDDVTPIITRSMQQLGDTHRELPATGQQPAVEAAPVDHLANINQAMRGERRVRTQVVLARLAEQNPAEYEHWTFQHLRAALAEHDITVAKSGGVKVIRAEDITTALAQRDATGTTDDGGDKTQIDE
ncbi:MAG: hypothetical protein GEV04_08595 [Actinophytocola sp.]|nr:hypothetical protein [Actinophytocola sp.]